MSFSLCLPQLLQDTESTYVLAGGYDAIWLLVLDPVDASPDKHPIERVERVWSEYKDLAVSPLSVVESLAGGARIEDLEKITGLSAVVR